MRTLGWYIERELLPACHHLGVGVVSYSPLARGVLTGKYQPGMAFPPESRAARHDRRIQQTELREESFLVAREIQKLARQRGCTSAQFATAWVLGNPLVTALILGPRTLAQFEEYIKAAAIQLSPEEDAAVDLLVAPGEHTQKGYQDPFYPVSGRPRLPVP